MFSFVLKLFVLLLSFVYSLITCICSVEFIYCTNSFIQ